MHFPRSTLAAALLTLLALGPGAPASAELCTIDPVPAATLLLPYFEVDLSKKRRVHTTFTIANANFDPQVAHVTLWTDWASATLAFDVFLTGYDVQRVDLGEIFREGTLPVTAHARNDPDDSISPHGGASSSNPQWDSDPDGMGNAQFLGCDALLPAAPLSEAAVERLRAAHTGRDTGTGCVGQDHGDDVARGYVTVDVVNDCTTLFPGEPDYTTTVLAPNNVLWGEALHLEKKKGAVAMQPLVGIEASGLGPGAGYTFYGRFGGDDREPLGTTWAMRRLGPDLAFGKKAKPIESDVVIWRDPKEDSVTPSYACGLQQPSWLPLEQTQVVSFDEEEDAVELCNTPTACAPLATQRLRLGAGDLAVPHAAGWWYWNLNHNAPGPFPSIAQSHVSTFLLYKNVVRAGAIASPLTSACQ